MSSSILGHSPATPRKSDPNTDVTSIEKTKEKEELPKSHEGKVPSLRDSIANAASAQNLDASLEKESTSNDQEESKKLPELPLHVYSQPGYLFQESDSVPEYENFKS